MVRKTAQGFTLIELLVVIAILAVIGVFVLVNYSSFGEDRNFKNAFLDVVSLLRQAQSNATTNTFCKTTYGANWQVLFSDAKTITLNCLEGTTTFPKKTLKLDAKSQNISIQGVSGTSCPAAVPFTINFALLSGKIDFTGYSNCNQLTVTLTNTKSTRSMIIETGGGIYEQQ